MYAGWRPLKERLKDNSYFREGCRAAIAPAGSFAFNFIAARIVGGLLQSGSPLLGDSDHATQNVRISSPTTDLQSCRMKSAMSASPTPTHQPNPAIIFDTLNA